MTKPSLQIIIMDWILVKLATYPFTAQKVESDTLGPELHLEYWEVCLGRVEELHWEASA